MIKIDTKGLNDLVEKHYIKLKNKFTNFPDMSRFTLEEVLKAKPEKLQEIALWFDTLSETEKKQFDFIKQLYKNFTAKKQEYDAYELAKELNINTCLYCNLNSIYTVIKNNNKKITRPTFDHFYDKSNYPILALSFYNLIPSCHACNSSLKGREKFSIKTYLHPYIDSFNALAKFQLHVKKSSFFYEEGGFDIELKTEDKRAEKHKEIFELEKRYEKHKDTVLELIQKRAIYPDSYIEELASNYSSVFKNPEDVLRLITCGYVEDRDLDKRPLSKLIKDISEELELI